MLNNNEINLIKDLFKGIDKPLYLHNLFLTDEDKNSAIKQINLGDIAVGNEIEKLINQLSSYFKEEELSIGLLNSGTSALHLSLENLNLNNNTDVLISPSHLYHQ